MKKQFLLLLVLCGSALMGFSQTQEEKEEGLIKEIRELQKEIRAERAEVVNLQKQKIKQLLAENEEKRTQLIEKAQANREVAISKMHAARAVAMKEMHAARIEAIKSAKEVYKSILENTKKEKNQIEKELQNN